jgi:hypothetical protein
VPDAPAEEHPESRGAEDHRKEQEAELQARELKEDDVRPY